MATNGTPITPLTPQLQEKAMTFSQALNRILEGKKVTRLDWKDKRHYCLLRDGLLQLHKAGEANDIFHPWIVCDKDMYAADWIEML